MGANHGNRVSTLRISISCSLALEEYDIDCLRTSHFLPMANATMVDAFRVKTYFPPGWHIELQESLSCKKSQPLELDKCSLFTKCMEAYFDFLEACFGKPLLGGLYSMESLQKSAKESTITQQRAVRVGEALTKETKS